MTGFVVARADARNQRRDVAGEPIGEQIEPVDAVHLSHSARTFNDLVHCSQRTLGWPTTLPGKGQSGIEVPAMIGRTASGLVPPSSQSTPSSRRPRGRTRLQNPIETDHLDIEFGTEVPDV